MKLDFSVLELSLSPIQRFSIWVGFAQGLDCVPGIGAVVERRVDDPIGTSP
jgi:hypothetical protein